MFFDRYGDEKNNLDEVADTQFMVGLYLMAAPILYEGQTSRDVYFS